MKRRKRLIEQRQGQQESMSGTLPAIAQAFNVGGYTDPVNYVAAATPPEGVLNPEGTPHRGPVEGYEGEGQA